MIRSRIDGRRIALAGFIAISLSACEKDAAAPAATATISGSPYLFVWSGDADAAEPDFLAVIDARSDAPTYGDIVATAPVSMQEGLPHHTEYEFPDDQRLFVNGWLASRSFILDLTNPLAPSEAAAFDGAEGYSFPHSYARLKNGNVLATFQGRDGKYGPPGGLVEIDPDGNAVRSVSALAPGSPEEKAWPYSLAISPGGERAIVSMAEMGMPPWEEFERTNHVQVWSTDNLELVAEVALPEEVSGWRHLDPAEPRFLADGTAYVSTFTCGLYRIDGWDGATPTVSFAYAFPGGDTFHNACAVPVAVGNFWVQTVGEINGLIVIDLSDPSDPKEVARLALDHDAFPMAHWVAADRASNRLVLTGGERRWVMVLELDPETGALTIDQRFGGGEGVVSFERESWPHGASGPAFVHGALFGGLAKDAATR